LYDNYLHHKQATFRRKTKKKPNQQHFDENFFEKMKKKMFLYFSTSSL